MSDIAVSVRNLTKTYRIFGHPGDRIKQALTFGRRRFHREFTALKDVSFDIRKGETVGIIGRNGSGKSTLLQLICGILKPTSGTVNVNGRISALLELGAGFNPEFTGRENVYFQGAVMGISKARMDERYDEIAAFADIGEFIDQPVRTYSSGMFVRLAFSVAISVEPDILVIDEALAVGDASFQAKCLIRLKALQATKDFVILFVSHDMVAVRNLCTRVFTLEKGEVVRNASPRVSAELYNLAEVSHTSMSFPEHHPLRRGPRRFASLQELTVKNIALEPAARFAMGDRMVIELTFECHEPLTEGRFGVLFSNIDGIVLHDFASGFSGVIGFPKGVRVYRIVTDPIRVYPGGYRLGAWIQHSKGVPSDDYFQDGIEVQIVDEGKVGHREANFSGIRCSNTEVFVPCVFERI